MLPVFGLNKYVYTELPSDAYRGYNTPGIGIPGSWPGSGAAPIPATARLPIISIRPDVATFNSGTLDTPLRSFAMTIPVGSVITLWAEGDGARFGFKPADIVAMHQRAYDLIKGQQSECLYAQIVEGYTARHGSLAPYVMEYADLYLIDGYPESTADTPAEVFDPAHSVVSPYGPVGITETNSMGAAGKLPDNPIWYAQAWHYAKAYGYTTFMAYGGPTVVLTSADVAALTSIKRESEAGILL